MDHKAIYESYKNVVSIIEKEGQLICSDSSGITVDIDDDVVESRYKQIIEEINQQKHQQEAKEYLKETDWYVLRKLHLGIEVPTAISKRRDEAIQQLS